MNEIKNWSESNLRMRRCEMEIMNLNLAGSNAAEHRCHSPRRWITLLCIGSVWFAFNLESTLQAAQRGNANELRTASVVGAPMDSASDQAPSVDSDAMPNETSLNSTDQGSFLLSSTGIIVTIVSMVAVGTMGYSLASAGKRGWGWVAVCLVGSLLALIVKLAVSMFQEISTENSVADWDSD
jgi:hypothetical protein